MEFTKDTSKMLASIYKIYLERRKEGQSYNEAAMFDKYFYKDVKTLSDFHESDIQSCATELKRAGFVKIFISGSFVVEKPLITYMENRFKSGITEVAKYIADLVAGIAESLIL